MSTRKEYEAVLDVLGRKHMSNNPSEGYHIPFEGYVPLEPTPIGAVIDMWKIIAENKGLKTVHQFVSTGGLLQLANPPSNKHLIIQVTSGGEMNTWEEEVNGRYSHDYNHNENVSVEEVYEILLNYIKATSV